MPRLVSNLRSWLIAIVLTAAAFVASGTWLALSTTAQERQLAANTRLSACMRSLRSLVREADRYPAPAEHWKTLDADVRAAIGAMRKGPGIYPAIQPMVAEVQAATAGAAALSPPADDTRQALEIHPRLLQAEESIERAVDVLRVQQDSLSALLAVRSRQMLWLVLVICMAAALVAIVWWRYQQTVVFRLRVQQQVQKSEEQFRALFEDAPVAYHELDLEGILRRVNRAECEMLGYERAEMLGKPGWFCVAPDSQAESQKAIREKLSGMRPLVPFERRFVRRDGSVLVLQVHETIIRNHAGNTTGIRTALFDITKRKQAEEDQREAASLLEATLEATADGVLVVDLQGRIVSYNQRFLDLWQIPPELAEERDGQAVQAHVQHQLVDPAQFRRRIAETYAQPAQETVDFLEFADGRIFERSSRPRRLGDQIVGRVWTFLDLTEHRHALQQLRSLEERWQLALQGNNDGLWDWNARTNEVFYSGRWKQILGYQEDELPNDTREWENRLHPADSSRVRAELQAHLDGKTRFYSSEYRIRAKDGTYRWVLARGQALWDEAGRPLRLVGSHTDITERKLAEEALLRARDEAEAGNRAKSEFLANMSHEIRTPMAGVLGMVDLVLNTEITAQQKEYLAMARDSANSLLELLNEILDLSKIEAGRLELAPAVMSLREPVEGALRLFAVRAQGKGLVLSCHVDADVPDLVVGDVLRIRQILLNLVGNALKFTDSGGVTVAVSVQSRTNSAVVLRFEVADTGIGIPAEKHQLVFDRFRQADGSMSRRYVGSGLGLTISAHLVDLMGGEIGLHSEEGKGSTFFFTLPLELAAAAVSGEPHVETVSAAPASAPGLRILLAEDNPVNQKLAALFLRREGHQVTLADDGLAAVHAAASNPFDVILMDVQMPRMDGFEATAAIRAAERGTGHRSHIIALTAHAMKGDQEKCLQAGMDNYLTKPIDLGRLHQLLAALAAPA